MFADARVAPLAEAITAGRLRWVATDAMRHEMERVLTRTGWPSGVDVASCLIGFDRWAQRVPVPASQLTLRCTDPDDQKFIDLAIGVRAAWLLSRDRAVLRLARRAAAWGLRVSADWAPPEDKGAAEAAP